MIELFIIWFALIFGCELYSYQVYGRNVTQAILDRNMYFDKYDYIAIFVLYLLPFIYFYLIIDDSSGDLDEY